MPQSDASRITQFIPAYPDFEDDLFSSKIYAKDEFRDLDVGKTKLPQQVFVSRYLSVNTLYNSLLVYHEPGTGKTCSAVSVVEAALNAKGSTIKNALVLTKGQGLIDNFVQEIVQVCERDRYSDIADSTRVRSKLYPRYVFDTYEVFVKKTEAIGSGVYDNHVIVLDEVHNLVTASKEEYKVIHEFLHSVRGCKIVLMTGTPMRDSASEFAEVMNLILPLDGQLPTGREFDAVFFKDGKIVNQKKIRDAIKGRVSYLRSRISDVSRVFVGEKLKGLRELVVYPVYMRGLQNKVYSKVSTIESDLYAAAQQASLFVFPDGSYGGGGFSKYFRKVEKNTSSGTKSVYLITNPEFVPAVQTQLPTLSTKYNSVLSFLAGSPDELAFVYGEYVEGSGLIVLSKILEAYGYTRSTGKDTTPGLRYGIVTNMTTTVKSTRTLLSLFNSGKNRYGKYVRVILGSRMISEGFTLKNVRQAHILTPHWNYGKTDQAIARTFRAFSHDALIADGVEPVLRVYQYVAESSDGSSIDAQMYRVSEEKDIMIKQVERIVKEAAVDCQIFKGQNTMSSSFDMTRACEYQTCEYSCGVEPLPIDYSTKDIYYPDIDGQKIYTAAMKAFPDNVYYIPDDHVHGSGTPTWTRCVHALVVDSALKMFGPISGKNTTGYVHVDGRTLYVSPARMENPDRGNMFYFKNPPKYFTRDIGSVARKYVYKYRVPLLLRDMCALGSSNDAEEFGLLLNELPDDVKRMLLEYSVVSTAEAVNHRSFAELQTTTAKTGFAGLVLDALSKYMYKTPDNMTVSSIGNVMRCLGEGENEWRDCPPDISEAVVAQRGDIEARARGFGYYGVVDGNKFLVKTIDVENVGDKRKAARGRVCATVDREDLDSIAQKAGIDTDGLGKRELCARLQQWFDSQSLMVYR
jgi:hypothetical protein